MAPSTLILAQSLVPGWVVLPMALMTLVVLGVHWVSLGSAVMPALRKRIRSACGLVMMLTIPVLAYGLGIVSTQDPRAFTLAWLVIMGLLIVVLLLAMADMLCVWREAAAERRELMVQTIAAREAILAKVRASQQTIENQAHGLAPDLAPNDASHPDGRSSDQHP